MLFTCSIILILLSNAILVAQVPEKQLYTTYLDSLWSMDTNLREISNDGKWATFIESFSEDKNILWVIATDGTKKMQLSAGTRFNFSSNSAWFACLDKKNELTTVNMDNFEEKRYPNISNYSFSPDGSHISIQSEVAYQSKKMSTINLQTQKIIQMEDVGTFVWHPFKNIIFEVIEAPNKSDLVQYDIESKRKKIIHTETAGSIKELYINPRGTSLIFLSTKMESIQLNYYDISTGTLKVLADDSIRENFPKLRISNRKPYLAGDGEKILFYLQDPEGFIKGRDNDSQTWNSADPWVAPRMDRYNKHEAQYFLTAWYPQTGLLREIETKNQPTAAMCVNQDFALVYDQLQYEPLYKLYPNVDLFVKNIKTGDTTLVCKNQYIEGQFVTISPEGKYISFFRDKDWWIYDVTKGLTTNITRDLSVNFQKTDLHDRDPHPYGIAGWRLNDAEVVLYDQFDIWVMNPNGKIKKRITKGREENIRYRIIRDYSPADTPLFVNLNFSSSRLDLTNNIFLEMFDQTTYKTGMAVWKPNSSIEPLFWEEGKIDQLFWNESGQSVVYRTQRFDQPIGINSYDFNNKRRKLMHQTNEKLLEYNLGETELIEYVLEDGTKLKGSLVYPANYSSTESYPMVVKIYERESKNILNFLPPGCATDNGFNLLELITNGYFVFFPDISYEIGNPGISALKSVTAAVEKVLNKKGIDKNRIGLIGHSFGGYETAFIITQTDMFSAAVAGAAVTNIVNYYHEVDWDMDKPQMLRLENQQMRFGDSYYNMKEAYHRNSPIDYVENVCTPLLLWTGKRDTNVNWSQSVQMFLALKRLGKTSKLLLYESEPHVLIKNKNQEHLCSSIFDWMELYVKKESIKTVSRS